ncbi:hypothetical protein [Nucisporomicrobium flavum]|uniref:hypothetical protein n=1 Tax=Nucisporomicrobium flavum TaxID=2785915 RepID=UPI0018F5138B|nr:hypothetical protein [Nucisporomicrobium flavum]
MTTTLFAGVEFPSTRHAQWALFFGHLCMPWLFRPHAFSVTGVDGFHPDFWLPEHRLWFQVGGDVAGGLEFRRWRRFAEAADDELYEVRESTLDRSWYPEAPHPIVALPPQWRARDALYAVGGVPAPDDMTGRGPVGGTRNSMYTACDRWYQWTRCPACGYIGAAFQGRADRLVCGHGDRERDGNCRADDPKILSAYRLAQQATTARMAGVCARCTEPVSVGDLIAAGRAVGARRWCHAGCHLTSQRERSRARSGGTLAAPAQRSGLASGA